MGILFLDTTYKTSLGLLDENLEWLEFKTFEDQKASGFLQNEVYKLCSKYNLKLKNLKAIITLSGPGFYTGLRVSEGFADICEFFGVQKFSFYSFDIPKILDFKEGVWITKAYRGEYFLHTWDKDGDRNSLEIAKDFQLTSLERKEVFIHTESSIDLALQAKKTLELLNTNSKKIFSYVLNSSLKQEVYYFRAPEDEFRMNP